MPAAGDAGIHSSRNLLWLALATASLLAPVVAYAITPPGKVSYSEGRVLVKRHGGKIESAEIGDSLFFGDSLVTKRSSRCQINMAATGVLRLASNTEIHFPMEGEENLAVAKWRQGKTWSNIKKLARDDVFEVKTPSLVAGIQDGGAPEVHGTYDPSFEAQVGRLLYQIQSGKPLGDEALRKARVLRFQHDLAGMEKWMGASLSERSPLSTELWRRVKAGADDDTRREVAAVLERAAQYAFEVEREMKYRAGYVYGHDPIAYGEAVERIDKASNSRRNALSALKRNYAKDAAAAAAPTASPPKAGRPPSTAGASRAEATLQINAWRQKRVAELKREGNARLDKIRRVLKSCAGKPAKYNCHGCGHGGPHSWDGDGWFCRGGCDATLPTSALPTAWGAYQPTRMRYLDVIAEVDAAADKAIANLPE